MDTKFTREVLKKVKHLEIKTRSLVNDSLAGHYHSVFKGQGMNFSELREYIPGDDVRNIDWNVTAKQGHPYIKKYTEERERTILLLVDISRSGDFGSGESSKKEIIAELASVLAFSAEKNNDKVGLILFTDRVELYIPPGKGRSHILRIIREILYFQPKGYKTDYIKIMNFINTTFSRKCVAFMISDFCLSVIPEKLKTKISATGKHHDLITIKMKDKNEENLPDVGLITLEDLETGEIIDVDTSNKKIRKRYNELIKERNMKVKGLIISSGVDYLELFTHESYIPPLIQFFTLRERRA